MDGLEMFSIQFTDVLEKEGLNNNCLRQQIWSNFLRGFEQTNEPETEDEWIDVYEKGYVKDRVRSAKVVINQP